MAKEFWFNLPVKDLKKSKQFFNEIGFIENPHHIDNSHLGSFFIGGKNVVMMLFPIETFKEYIPKNATHTNSGTEVLFNIDAQSKEEVDAMVEIVKKAGGTIYAKPYEKDGWLYGFGFSDPDAHSWSVLYMDMSKMPQ
ncbi:VOC family protein [Mariniflexile gromovii]|uniref:Extradiol dioxygenase n=1 Tax=Mariniflexile gromovii TaxID=362523 RepID=A0ABS4BPK8_9FLAO|nr:VOC family protein [Mariniflexile gromovii]MBP0902528.1 extradiol dioxygenase [Mariniflexile gromovii]